MKPIVRVTGTRYVGFSENRRPPIAAGTYLNAAELHHDIILLCDQVRSRTALARDLSGRWPSEVEEGCSSAPSMNWPPAGRIWFAREGTPHAAYLRSISK